MEANEQSLDACKDRRKVMVGVVIGHQPLGLGPNAKTVSGVRDFSKFCLFSF
jgi:hypothetical protein